MTVREGKMVEAVSRLCAWKTGKDIEVIKVVVQRGMSNKWSK